MCLCELTTDKPCKRGFKIVRVDDMGEYYPMYRNADKTLPKGVWLHEEDYRDELGGLISVGGTTKTYQKGFHVYHHRRDAEYIKGFEVKDEPDRLVRIVQVQVHEPVAVGLQSGSIRVTVAKQIKIGKEVN